MGLVLKWFIMPDRWVKYYTSLDSMSTTMPLRSVIMPQHEYVGTRMCYDTTLRYVMSIDLEIWKKNIVIRRLEMHARSCQGQTIRGMLINLVFHSPSRPIILLWVPSQDKWDLRQGMEFCFFNGKKQFSRGPHRGNYKTYNYRGGLETESSMTQ